MVDYTGALKKAFSNIPNLVIGTIIAAIPILSILLLGYGVRIIEEVSKGAKETPKWSEDIGGLIVKSILVFLIVLIYMIPTLIVFALVAGALIASLAAGLIDPNAILGALGTAGTLVLLGALVGLLTVYILPSAIVSFARGGSFGSAFAIGTVIKKAFSVAYFVTALVVLVLSLILMTIASMIPLIGFVLVGLVSYIITVFSYTAYAEAIKK